MRYLIFADLHANIYALQKMLNQASQFSVDKILSLGDLVGYNSYPNECLDIIREKKIVSVKGNHEALATGQLSMKTCKSERSQNAIEITSRLLTPENKRYIRELSETVFLGKDIRLQHAGFDSVYKTLNSLTRVKPEFEQMREASVSTVFFGHTHRPGMFHVSPGLADIQQDTSLRSFSTASGYYMVNPGSLGEPRHGLPSSFLLFETEFGKIEFKTVALSASEQKELQRNNRRMFGITSFKRLPKQVKEKSRRVYYQIGRLKDSFIQNQGQ